MLVDWVLDMGMHGVDPDPYRSRTELGSLGRLKKYDAIVLRVYADEKDSARMCSSASRQLQHLRRRHLGRARRADGEPGFGGRQRNLDPGT